LTTSLFLSTPLFARFRNFLASLNERMNKSQDCHTSRLVRCYL
jgi:hypothetical protein